MKELGRGISGERRAGAAPARPEHVGGNGEGGTTVTLHVPGIHCEGCLQTIRDGIGAVAGAAMVEGDPGRKTVTVTYDPSIASLPQIEDALEARGFPARPAHAGDSHPGRARSAHPFRLTLVAVGLACLLATAGYLLGFQGFIYGVAVPNAFDRLGVVAVGAIAGTAAFFSPCVFPLLPAYASYYLATSSSAAGERTGALRRSLGVGLPAAAGVTAVTLGIGAVIAAVGAAAPFQPDVREEGWVILAIRFAAGMLIAAMGVLMLLGRAPGTSVLSRLGAAAARRTPRAGGARGFFLYGLTYNAAGIGCTGPILLSVMLYYALLSRQALLAFFTFAMTMAAWMLAVTALVALAQRSLLARLREGVGVVHKVGAAVLVTLGTYTMLVQSFEAGREWFVRVFLRFLL